MMLFVVGAARSGTTMMARLLGAHPKVFSFRELNFFEQEWVPEHHGEPLEQEQAVELVSTLMRNQAVTDTSSLPAADYRDQAESFLKAYEGEKTRLGLYKGYMLWETRDQGKEVPCSKTPRDIYYVEEILTAYPEAKVIWMIRDPRAVICSQKLRWRNSLRRSSARARWDAFCTWMNYHPITYSLIWRAAMTAGNRASAGENLVPVQFERFVSEGKPAAARLFARLGLKYSGELERIGWYTSSHRPDSDEARGMDVGAIDRWREGCLRSSELFFIEWLCGSWMRRLNYQRDAVWPNPLGVLIDLLSWIPKGLIALLINRRRVASTRTALARRLFR